MMLQGNGEGAKRGAGQLQRRILMKKKMHKNKPRES